MAPRINQNKRTASTTFDYDPERMRPSRRDGKHSAKHRRWGHLAKRSPYEKLTLTIKYRGGAEGWYLVEARGSHGVFPAVAAIHDVMREINNQH